MTDERPASPSGATADEVAADKDRRRDEPPEGPSAPDTPASRDAPPASTDDDTSPLLREGPDAPDAADIEDPDEQL